VHAKLWSGYLKGSDHLKDIGVERILEKYENVCTGFIWLRIESSGGLL